MKTISLLGSTGSIGTQTLEVVQQHTDKYHIAGLTTNKNIDLLKQQIEQCKPEAVAVMDVTKAGELADQVDIPVYKGIGGLKKIASLSDTTQVVNALVGSVGIEPTLAAVEAKKNIALANKETLVAAGSVVMAAAAKNNVTIMPIDSEHSAIFQCLVGEKKEHVSKITLTASGGPFRNFSKAQLQQVTVDQALNHPTWKMGGKITIDSATLMNKGFEVMEAHWLYDIPYRNIEVVIHPQSVIHSLVHFKDSSIKAQLGLPSMKVPIQYALSYPERLPHAVEQLDLAKLQQFTFEEPKRSVFPCLNLAYDAGKKGGTAPAVLNAANESAVAAFLDNKISFTSIPKIISDAVQNHSFVANPSLSQILTLDKEVKQSVSTLLEQNEVLV